MLRLKLFPTQPLPVTRTYYERAFINILTKSEYLLFDVVPRKCNKQLLVNIPTFMLPQQKLKTPILVALSPPTTSNLFDFSYTNVKSRISSSLAACRRDEKNNLNESSVCSSAFDLLNFLEVNNFLNKENYGIWMDSP